MDTLNLDTILLIVEIKTGHANPEKVTHQLCTYIEAAAGKQGVSPEL